MPPLPLDTSVTVLLGLLTNTDSAPPRRPPFISLGFSPTAHLWLTYVYLCGHISSHILPYVSVLIFPTAFPVPYSSDTPLHSPFLDTLPFLLWPLFCPCRQCLCPSVLQKVFLFLVLNYLQTDIIFTIAKASPVMETKTAVVYVSVSLNLLSSLSSPKKGIGCIHP